MASVTEQIGRFEAYHSRQSLIASGMMLVFFAAVMVIFYLRISEERERSTVNASTEQAAQNLRTKRADLEIAQTFASFLSSETPAEFTPQLSDVVDQPRRDQFTTQITPIRRYDTRICIDIGPINMPAGALSRIDDALPKIANDAEIGRALCEVFAGGDFARLQLESKRVQAPAAPITEVSKCYPDQNPSLFKVVSKMNLGYSYQLSEGRCDYGQQVNQVVLAIANPHFDESAQRYARAKLVATRQLDDAKVAVTKSEREVAQAETAFALATGRLQNVDATFWWTLALHIFFATTAFLGINASYQLARQHNFELVELQRRQASVQLNAQGLTGTEWPVNPFHPSFKLARLKLPQEELIQEVVKATVETLRQTSKLA